MYFRFIIFQSLDIAPSNETHKTIKLREYSFVGWWLVNAVSLTTPAVSRVFSLLFQETRAHFSVGARSTSFSAACVSLCHPNLLSLFTIIDSVWPTKHLFDHHRP